MFIIVVSPHDAFIVEWREVWCCDVPVAGGKRKYSPKVVDVNLIAILEHREHVNLQK